jgi:hypothetical protein
LREASRNRGWFFSKPSIRMSRSVASSGLPRAAITTNLAKGRPQLQSATVAATKSRRCFC